MFSTIRYVLFLKLTSLYQMIRESLHNYIYNEIIPKYAVFDKAHHEDHALAVIDRALSMGRQYNINEEMLLTAAACHDLGLAIDRKTHHLESGRIIRTDSRLSEWFSPEQIEVIAQAAEDHRASSITPPRSIYGCLVAEADRVIDPEIIIRRTFSLVFHIIPNWTRKAIGNAPLNISTRNMPKAAIFTCLFLTHQTKCHSSSFVKLSRTNPVSD